MTKFTITSVNKVTGDFIGDDIPSFEIAATPDGGTVGLPVGLVIEIGSEKYEIRSTFTPEGASNGRYGKWNAEPIGIRVARHPQRRDGGTPAEGAEFSA